MVTPPPKTKQIFPLPSITTSGIKAPSRNLVAAVALLPNSGFGWRPARSARRGGEEAKGREPMILFIIINSHYAFSAKISF